MAWSGDLAGLAVDWGDASLEALLPDSDASVDTLPEFDACDAVDASDAVDVGDAGIDALPNDDASDMSDASLAALGASAALAPPRTSDAPSAPAGDLESLFGSASEEPLDAGAVELEEALDGLPSDISDHQQRRRRGSRRRDAAADDVAALTAIFKGELAGPGHKKQRRRIRRLMRRGETRAVSASEALSSTKAAWDMLQLRHGEMLDDGGSTGGSNSDGLLRQSKSWTEEGLLRTSFTAIGKRDPYGQTRNVVDAITGVSLACFQQFTQ